MALVIEGEERIAAPLQKVWEALNDPEVLKATIPGCQSLDMTSPTEMTATVVLKIGPIKATFNGEVTLKNLNPPNSYTIQGEGKGGIAGFAKGGADVTLTADGPDATVRPLACFHALPYRFVLQIRRPRWQAPPPGRRNFARRSGSTIPTTQA